MKKMRHRRTPSAEMNLTALMDVVFVLLVAFMVVAPALKHGIDLELPQVREAPTLTTPGRPITVQIRADRTSADGLTASVAVNGERCSIDAVTGIITRLQNPEKSRAVTIEADSRVPWDVMANLLTNLRKANITNVGLVTDRVKENT